MKIPFRCTFAATVITASLLQPAVAAEIDIIEFYNTHLNHYFITNPTEAAMIDAGSAGPGWVRTGQSFKGSDVSGVNVAPTCRFYTTGANSHFYTAEASECNQLKALNPQNVLGPDYWTYEGIAFHARIRNDQSCGVGNQPVYRFYNNRAAEGDSNHRFVTDAFIYQQMAAQNWIAEGVAICTTGKTTGTPYQASSGLHITLEIATATDLSNGYRRYWARIKQSNSTSVAIAEDFLTLHFTDGTVIKPSIFTGNNVLPGGDGFAVYRTYQYDAPSSLVPLLWEYGGEFFAQAPTPGALQWHFPVR